MNNLFINEHKYPLLSEALKAEDGRKFYRALNPDDRAQLDKEAETAFNFVQDSINPMIARLQSFAIRIKEITKEEGHGAGAGTEG